MGLGSKTDLYSNYQKIHENLGQNQTSPFANLDLKPINSVQQQAQNPAQEPVQQRPVQQRPVQQRPVQQEPVQQQPQPRVVQTQTGSVPVHHFQDNKPASQGVVGQKVTKRTKKGDTYSYADKYDHSKDIKPRKVVPITFRIDADEYERFKMIAQRERVSVNQLMIRAMSQFR